MNRFALAFSVLVIGVATIAVGQEFRSVSAYDSSKAMIICLDSERSIVWKTAMEFPLSVSVMWPEGADKAVLTVKGPNEWKISAEITDRKVSEYEFGGDLPMSESEECVLSLCLAYFDANGEELLSCRKMSKLGIVRSIGEANARVVFSDCDSRKWQRPYGCAVVQLPENANTFCMNGETVQNVSAPEWMSLELENASKNTLVLDCRDETLERILFGEGRSLIISFK